MPVPANPIPTLALRPLQGRIVFGGIMAAAGAALGIALALSVPVSQAGAAPKSPAHAALEAAQRMRDEHAFDYRNPDLTGKPRPAMVSVSAVSDAQGIACTARIPKAFNGGQLGVVEHIARQADIDVEQARQILDLAVLRQCLGYMRDGPGRASSSDMRAAALDAGRAMLSLGEIDEDQFRRIVVALR